MSLSEINRAVCDAAKGNQEEQLDALLEHEGADVYVAVVAAAEAGHQALVMKLLSRPEANLITAAVCGAARGNQQALLGELFKREDADVNVAVKAAAKAARKDLVIRLLEVGADISEAVVGAAEGGHSKLVDYLFQEDPDPNDISHEALGVAMECAAGRNDLVQVYDLLGRGGRIVPAVCAAAKGGHIDAMNELLTRCNNIDIELVIGRIEEKPDIVKHLEVTKDARMTLDACLRKHFIDEKSKDKQKEDLVAFAMDVNRLCRAGARIPEGMKRSAVYFIIIQVLKEVWGVGNSLPGRVVCERNFPALQLFSKHEALKIVHPVLLVDSRLKALDRQKNERSLVRGKEQEKSTQLPALPTEVWWMVLSFLDGIMGPLPEIVDKGLGLVLDKKRPSVFKVLSAEPVDQVVADEGELVTATPGGGAAAP